MRGGGGGVAMIGPRLIPVVDDKQNDSRTQTHQHQHPNARVYVYVCTQAGFRKENILPNVAEWWANGNMIDNEKARWVVRVYNSCVHGYVVDNEKARFLP